MANPYGIPTTIDTVALTASLADYRKTLVDNVYDDVVVMKLAGADAVLVASIFHYGEYTIREAKEYLKSEGISVRM